MPGHQALHKQVMAALDTCVESQSVEFKESAPWKDLEVKIIRTALAMANLRDGGVLVDSRAVARMGFPPRSVRLSDELR